MFLIAKIILRLKDFKAGFLEMFLKIISVKLTNMIVVGIDQFHAQRFSKMVEGGSVEVRNLDVNVFKVLLEFLQKLDGIIQMLQYM